MAYDVDKIFDRLDEYYQKSDNAPQAKRPNDLPVAEYDMKKIEFLDAMSELEEKRKKRRLEMAKNVHEFINEVKKQTWDDQAELMKRFKEALELGL